MCLRLHLQRMHALTAAAATLPYSCGPRTERLLLLQGLVLLQGQSQGQQPKVVPWEGLRVLALTVLPLLPLSLHPPLRCTSV